MSDRKPRLGLILTAVLISLLSSCSSDQPPAAKVEEGDMAAKEEPRKFRDMLSAPRHREFISYEEVLSKEEFEQMEMKLEALNRK